MTETTPKGDHTVDYPAVAATCDFAGIQFKKEQLDLACAAEVLASLRLTERQLSWAVADWSIHGDTPLVARLVAVGLLTEDDRTRCEAAAESRLETALVGSGHGTDASLSTLATVLEQIDPTGRVTRLLGFFASSLPTSESASRTSLGRYTLIRKLGQGGLGTVWLALDEHIKRYVALKELSSHGGESDAAVARFRREAEITGRLEHPGIVPVYQFGEDAGSGRVFYAMRFLGKRTLQNAIDDYHEMRRTRHNKPMLLRHLLSAFFGICNAIAHAHSRKVIHRDLKPANVAINSFGQVIVIDWGMAKLLDEADTSDLALAPSQDADTERTVAGQVLGTPLYMAPEQAAGRIDDIDERTDVYGLGAILFAILTGAAPHEKSLSLSGKSGSRGLISAIAEGQTPSVREANPNVDPALAAICEKALAKRPYARYQSAEDLGEEVQRWMAGEPVSACPETVTQRLGRWILNHKRLSHSLGALITVALVAGGMFGVMAYQAREAARQTEFEEMRADGREIELQLSDAAEELSKEVRFMSTLPPIQAIITAQSHPDEPGTDSEDIWRTRLETIYEGLLRANPDYLSVAYIGIEDSEASELVRVERHRTDPAYLRTVPRTRLAIATATPFLEETLCLEPGEVHFFLVQEKEIGRPVLFGAVPVYDNLTGAVFGVVILEAELTAWIERILDELASRSTEVYVTSGEGRIWVSSLPETGVQDHLREANITQTIPALEDFFGPTHAGQSYLASDEFIAKRMLLDAQNPRTAIGIVLHLPE